MKVNVKGLVFVGFAAAILSGAARAADGDQHIVTSLAYTEDTYQKKADKVTGASEDIIGNMTTNDTKFVTPKAVVQYVGQQAGASDFTGATASSDGVHGLVPAPSSGDEGKFLKGDGTWANETTYNDVTAATSSAAGTHGLVPAPASANYNTTQFLKNNGQWTTPDSTPTDNSDNLITSDAVYEAVNTLNTGKQPKVAGGTNDTKAHVGNGDDGWLEVAPSNYFNMVKENDGSKDVMHIGIVSGKLNTDGTGIGTFQNASATGADSLVTAYAVQEAIDGVTTTANAAQVKSDANYSVGNVDGGWDTMVNGTNTTITRESDGNDGYNVKVNVATMTGATSGAAGTAGVVPVSAAGDQDKVLSAAGTWVDRQTQLGGSGQDGKLVTATGTAGSVNYTSVESTGSNIATNQSTIPTSGAVADYVTGQLAAQPASAIPAKSTTICTADYPCALVAEGDYLNWRVMAVSSSQTGTHAAGYCGNASGTCNTGTAPANNG